MLQSGPGNGSTLSRTSLVAGGISMTRQIRAKCGVRSLAGNVAAARPPDDVCHAGKVADQAGDHGDYGGAGLVAASYDNGQELGRINTGRYPISHVRVDPFSNNVWAITTDRIVVVRSDLEIQSTYVFYYGFDSKTKRPEPKITNRPTLIPFLLRIRAQFAKMEIRR